jgi:hypothetical protein
MPARRRDIELSVERPLGPASTPGATVRLTARFDVGDGAGPTHAELAAALEQLQADLEGLVGSPIAAAGIARGHRELSELIETYRPRQRELIDLLLADGEISGEEHRLLREYLGGTSKESGPPPAGPVSVTVPPASEAPIAAMPIAAERTSEPVRPVEELIERYEITSLRQAGAVRGKREISFAEYMALKRHFEQAAKPPEKPAKT